MTLSDVAFSEAHFPGISERRPPLPPSILFGQAGLILYIMRPQASRAGPAFRDSSKASTSRRDWRPVAVKLLAPHWSADNEHVRRFRREALDVSALNHPNIITIYEIGEWNGRDFIATEFVDGVTLREYMRAGNLTVAASLDIALQITSALAAARGAGIVHRDI